MQYHMQMVVSYKEVCQGHLHHPDLKTGRWNHWLKTMSIILMKTVVKLTERFVMNFIKSSIKSFYNDEFTF